MSGWSSGYVTDIAYMTGYYRHQSPAVMALACLLGGVASPMPGRDDPVSYLELGCGQGFGALILAASNPHWTVTAIDFNPAHVAAARAWAAQAGIENVSFLEADLSSLAEDSASSQVPAADFVSMHGVWSWVPPAVQSGIVRLLRAKVKPGGAVHVSYNSLPAWGSALGMQRMVRECGRRLGTRSDRQAGEGLKLVQELRAADALQLKRSPLATSLIDRIGIMPAAYLAHEYMNDSFAPCFHADVAQAFADAKLEWAASASLIENFPELVLTPEQRAVTQRLDDPLVRELMKDMCLERSLRHDVFVRGARQREPGGARRGADGCLAGAEHQPGGYAVRGRDAGRPGGTEPQLLRTDHRGDGNGAATRGRPARGARPGGPARQPGRADRHPGGSRSGGAGGAAGRRTDAAGPALQPRQPWPTSVEPKTSAARSPRRATPWGRARRARCSTCT